MGPLTVPGDPLLLRDADGGEHRATVGADGTIAVGDRRFSVHRAHDGSLRVEDSSATTVWAVRVGETTWVFADGQVFTFELARAARRKRPASQDGSLHAPMPATVRKIAVEPGAAVRRGDVLIVLEAMKMELPIRADADGTVRRVNCREGEMVQPGTALVEIVP